MSASLNKEYVVKSCLRLVSTAENVTLSSDSEFKVIANKLKVNFDSFDAFKEWKRNELNPQIFNDFTIEWIFLCDLLNFSFWDDERSFNVEFNGKIYKNYWSLPATLNKFSHILVDPNFYSKINSRNFDLFFNPNIPLKQDRIRLMNEAGQVLIEKYNGSFVNFLKSAGTIDAWNFINRLIKEFPSFRDYNNEFSVWFLKRAQILVADLWAASKGTFFGETIGDLTIFSDYRYKQKQ